MKKMDCFAVVSILFIAFFTMSFVACSEKKNSNPEQQIEDSSTVKHGVDTESKKVTKPEDMPAVFGKSDLRMVTATVTAIDLQKRLVTLKKSSGEQFTMVADEKVKKLRKVKVGDEVLSKYYESITARVMQPDEAEVPHAANKSVVSAPLGQKPAGVATAQFTTTAKIMDINKEKLKATLIFGDGITHVVDVEHPEYLDKVKIGDRIEIVHTESIAIQVKAVARKKAAAKQ